MSQQEFILWSDCKLDQDSWHGYIRQECSNLTEPEQRDMICELNHDLLDQTRSQLDIALSQPILVIRNFPSKLFQLPCYWEIPSGNIRDCLLGDTKHTTWFVDSRGDLHRQSSDGEHSDDVLYRVYRDGVTNDQIADLKGKLFEGTALPEDLYRITRRLGPIIAKVFALPFPEAPSRTLVM